jgi:cytochrome c biogenesis protein CcdA
MNQKILSALWGGLFIVCAGLGFIPEPEGSLQILLTVLSLLFFLPPALLLYHAVRKQDKASIQLIRNLAGLSLGLTVVLLILNFLTVFTSEILGQILHYVLTIVSCPMICSGHWVMSLFLWACLLTASQKQLKK